MTTTETPPQAAEGQSPLNSATLIMGITKSGKSSLLVTAAEYVWETYQLISHYYLCDGGGFPVQAEAMINSGIMRLWRMRTRSAPQLAHETCQRAALGWWPRRINARTGETMPNVALVPPVTERYTMLCPQGHTVKVVPFKHLLTDQVCPTCQVPVTAKTMRVEKTVTRTKGFERVGACLYDGLSSMISWGMDDLAERTGTGDLKGESGAIGGIVRSGDFVMGSSNRSHYGFMQKRAEGLVLASNSIPGLVVPPVWTALTQEGSDEGGLRVKGPQLIGQAKTADAPQWFGDTLETIVIEHDGKKYRRLCLQQYVDKDNVRHLCGIRSYPGMLPPYLEDEDDGSGAGAFVNFSLKTFYTLRDAARERAMKMLTERYPNAPGTPETEMEFGDDAIAAATAPAARPAPGAPGARPGVVAKPAGTPAGKPVGGAVAKPAGVPPAAAATTPAAAPAAPAAPAATPAAARPAPAPVAAPPAASPAPPAGAVPAPAAARPSPVATGPTASRPAAPQPPARGPVAPPAGRKP